MYKDPGGMQPEAFLRVLLLRTEKMQYKLTSFFNSSCDLKFKEISAYIPEDELTNPKKNIKI